MSTLTIDWTAGGGGDIGSLLWVSGTTSQPIESYFTNFKSVVACTFQYTKYQSDEKVSITIFIVICSHPVNVAKYVTFVMK